MSDDLGTWKKVTMEDLLEEVTGDLSDFYEDLKEVLEPTLEVLNEIGGYVSEAKEYVAGLVASGVMKPLADWVEQRRDEILATGFKAIPLWDFALDDYWNFLKEGKRTSQTKGISNYGTFMQTLVASMSDVNDVDRPITEGPCACAVFLVAAPTFIEIAQAVKVWSEAFNFEDLKQLVARMEQLAKNPETKKYYALGDAEPPNFVAYEVRDMIPPLADFLDESCQKIVDWLYRNSYLEDGILKAVYLIIKRIENINKATIRTLKYIQALPAILQMGGYALAVVTGNGINDLTQKLLTAKEPPNFQVDMFCAGFAVVAEAPSTGEKKMPKPFNVLYGKLLEKAKEAITEEAQALAEGVE